MNAKVLVFENRYFSKAIGAFLLQRGIAVLR
jgi:hypothetical protein